MLSNDSILYEVLENVSQDSGSGPSGQLCISQLSYLQRVRRQSCQGCLSSEQVLQSNCRYDLALKILFSKVRGTIQKLSISFVWICFSDLCNCQDDEAKDQVKLVKTFTYFQS